MDRNSVENAKRAVSTKLALDAPDAVFALVVMRTI